MNDPILRPEGVAVELGVSITTVFRWVKLGRFPRPVPFGGFKLVGWRRSVIDQWMAERNRTAFRTGA